VGAQHYALTTPGAEPPVTVKQAKDHLKIENTADDGVIGVILGVAEEFAAGYTAQELRANTWTLLLDEFGDDDEILLRRHPVASITSVKHTVDGSPVTISSADYLLEKGVQSSRIYLADGASWPTDTDNLRQGVEVVFVTEVLPKIDSVKLGILRHVAYLYENRGDVDSGDSAKKSGATVFYDQVRISRV
jgi:uncharacterized phiE125 gp8 family phage protein